FCAAPNISVPCLPGFYCPANTAQPTLCCKGYLCSPDTKTIEVCPAGFFCPAASTRALPCNFLAFCPRGTTAVEKYGLGAVLLAFALMTMAVFSVKKRIFRAQRLRYRQRLRELGDNSDDLEDEKRQKKEAAQLAQSFDIRFEKLGLTLPTGVDIIKNISGRLITGRTCAVMGPSGAGKTTFLSILAGKVAKTDGSIKVNGKEQTLSLWKKLIGFVPQEDVMLSDLSVREILMHSARMRQPVHMSHNEKRLKVLEVIQFLGLGHIMDNPIGDVETRGVSGGERKRVNIGMELVASPSILFLDEPTSGLDSATSLEVCKLLKQIAQEQFLTVAAVVHSPSPHAFNQFDDLVLLGSGGRVVYSGPRDEASYYFESIGYPVPEDESPADFFISLAAGRVDKSPRTPEYESQEDDDDDAMTYGYQETSKSKTPHCHVSTMALHQPSRPQSPTFSVPISNLAGSSADTTDQVEVIKNQGQGFWTSLRMSFITSWADSVSYIRDVFGEMGHWLWTIKCKFTGEQDPVRETPSFGSVFILCFKRACLQNYRSQMGFLSDQSLHLACGLCVSFASKDMMYTPRQPAEICAMAPPAIQLSCATPLDDIRYVGMFMSLGVYFAGISVGSSTFGDEKAVYWRDTSAGMPTLPYYLAKILADVPRMIVAACMYTGAFIFFFAYRQQLSSLFLVILLLYINAFSLGYFVSAVVNRSMFGLAGTGMSLAWALVLSGTAPHLYKVMNSGGYATVRWIWDVSAPRWGVEAFYLKEMDSRM
ncbi:P-loop containing nucleoside triphosphate hydrolase protein, partial [Linnemannia elongata]